METSGKKGPGVGTRRSVRPLRVQELEPRIAPVNVNYAILFSGGWNAGSNHDRYYTNICNMYSALIGDCGLLAANVYIIYADGTDPAVDRSSGVNSDMSFAAGSTVLSASAANLQSTLTTLSGLVDATDHFLFYAFDHGSGAYNDPSQTNEEALCGWGENISDSVLAGWLNGVNAGYCSYVFAECFAGGMLDDLMPLATNRFACAATNHYEYSWGDGFANAFYQALHQKYRNTYDAYQYAYTHDPYATDGEGPGGAVGDWEHPWKTGSNFSIFYRPSNQAPTLTEIKTLNGAVAGQNYTISYDMLAAAGNENDADGDALDYVIESVKNGTLTKDGAPVVPGVTVLRIGESLVWCGTGAGTVPAFSVVVSDGVLDSASAVNVPVHFQGVIYQANMDTNPGWTLSGGWAWGIPTGGSGSMGGPDPTSGYTGAEVVGYNLSGGYPNNLIPTQWATTQAIDCSAYSNVTLSFYRWLGVENSIADHAYVEVSSDGVNWTQIWANPSISVNDTAWDQQIYDISGVADGEATVYVRWGMGTTNAWGTFCGWNLDDVRVTGDTTAESISLYDGQVILYDVNPGSGAHVQASDVLVRLDRAGSVTSLQIVGNPSGLGIVINPKGAASVSVTDSRNPLKVGPLQELAFVAVLNPTTKMLLGSAVAGYDLGPLLVSEGLLLDPDLDGDGIFYDTTAIYCSGPMTMVKVSGCVRGDAVAAGVSTLGVSIGSLQIRNGYLAGEVSGVGDLTSILLYGGTAGGGVRTATNLGRLVSSYLFVSSTVDVGSDAKLIQVSGNVQSSTIRIGGTISNLSIAGRVSDSEIALGSAGMLRLGGITGASSVHALGNVGQFDVKQGIMGGSTVNLAGQVAVARVQGSAFGSGIDDASTVSFGSLRSGLLVEGDLAGTVDVAGWAGATIQIKGSLTGTLLAGMFGNVTVMGQFSGQIGDAGTAPGVRNVLRVTVPGGGGVVTPPNAFARYSL